MRILIISCIPKRPSLGESLVLELGRRFKALGHETEWHELYEEGFDPLLDPQELARGTSFDELVLAHAEALLRCEGLVIVHPDWWGQPPALLKGWIDRVFRQGVAYELLGEDGGEKTWQALHEGKRAFALVTSDSEDRERVSLLRSIWVTAVLGPCGFEAECFTISGLRTSLPAEKKADIDLALRMAEAWVTRRSEG